MRPRSAFAAPALLALAALTACANPIKPVQPALSVSLLPQPLRVGPARVVASLRDSAGHPIAGARIMVITSEPALRMGYQMPMQGMGKAVQTLSGRTNRSGQYAASVQIAQATLWSIVVHAESREGLTTVQIYERAEPGAALKQ